ncbi:hypothetical protein N8000_07380 [Rhodospirillales bacterium]|nr:hypothetical protein [Rhodospirillales bacterium]
MASNVTWSLPTADGTADQVLKTDGSSNLAWTTITGAIGFAVSSITTAPASSSNYDLAESAAQDGDETPFVASADAFGVSTVAIYDCMEPVGSTVTVDYGSGESHIGA